MGQEDELLKTNAARIRVLLAGDLDSLDDYVGDDLIYVSPAGKPQTKKQVYEGFRSGRVKMERMEIDDVSVRLYGPIGIVAYRANARIVDGDHVFDGSTRSTAVYQYQDDNRWRLISQHVCAIADPP